jgi:hypothetical protein
MRLVSLLLCLAVSVNWPPATAPAQDVPDVNEIAAARDELRLAKLEFRDYWLVEYPRIQRHLDAQIRLTEAEVRTIKERIRMYDPFNRFSTGSAVTWALQDLRMCLLDAELRLRDLWAERSNLIRFRTPQWRILEARVHDARWRLAELQNAREAAEFPDG